MIRFVDLNTGNTFDGAHPYIFWLDGEQSTNIIYSKPICFISNNKTENISINKNEIFHIIDPKELLNSNVETIYGFEYKNISNLDKLTNYTSIGVPHHNYYVHIIYILASAKQPGEYKEEFKIGDDKYIIGGDFYGENESLYINLSNNGVEIPEIIQKALYDANIHEDNKDNILINRKWKELLSNFWDIIANKGSYKSLYNSLKWFEYGDKLRICELWKNNETEKFFIKEMQELLSDNYFKTLNNFTKTTYIALYYALEEPKMDNGELVLDEEKNPNLKYIVSKWSIQDLALKLSMLGSFFETYFMPIHLDLIHATIEDVVYTNNFKLIGGTASDREDYVYSFEDIKCNVKDGDVYKLGKAQCYVGPNTLFGLSYDEYSKDHIIMGVQTKPAKLDLSTPQKVNEDYVAFASQLYNDIGTVVDFNINLKLAPDDYIKRELLIYKFNGKFKTTVDYKILNDTINFQLLCPEEGEYEVRLQFDSVAGKVFIKRIKFSVIDYNSVTLKIYKILNVQIPKDDMLDKSSEINDYIYSLRKVVADNQTNVIQYIPAKIDNLNESKFKWKGVCLNHLLIINENIETLIERYGFNKVNPIFFNILHNHYFMRYKNIQIGDNKYQTYTICISRVFGFSPKDDENILYFYNTLLEKGHIYRDDNIFVPEFHKLVEFGSNKYTELPNIKHYTITDEDSLCIIPSLPYGKTIEGYDWEFINVSRGEIIGLKYIKEPFISNDKPSPLEPGYYNIKLNYKLNNDDKINTVMFDSAFKKI